MGFAGARSYSIAVGVVGEGHSEFVVDGSAVSSVCLGQDARDVSELRDEVVDLGAGERPVGGAVAEKPFDAPPFASDLGDPDADAGHVWLSFE